MQPGAWASEDDLFTALTSPEVSEMLHRLDPRLLVSPRDLLENRDSMDLLVQR